MHLIAAKPGGFTDEEGIVDLNQSPGDVVLLLSSDGLVAALADALEGLIDKHSQLPSVRLANWLAVKKPAAFDLYQDKVIDHAKVVVVSLLGGKAYWQYGVERLVEWAAADSERQLVLIPGDDSADAELTTLSTVHEDVQLQIWRYCREGGRDNLTQLYSFIFSELLGQKQFGWQVPKALPKFTLYCPEAANPFPSLADWQAQGADNSANTVLLLFYQTHLHSANTAIFTELAEVIKGQGLTPLMLAIPSLKDADCLAFINNVLESVDVKVILNTTGFASNVVGSPALSAEPLAFTSQFVKPLPVLQLILSSGSYEDWQEYSQGLRSRDIAMQIVLPEMDGRIITRAIGFKSENYYSEQAQTAVIRYQLEAGRAQFVAELAAKYCALASQANADKRIAFILANYPTKDGRIGNGVGLDTPQSLINLLRALQDAGYPIADIPDDGTALIEALLMAVTNNPNTVHYLPCWQSLAIEQYQIFFQTLPEQLQTAVLERWGAPEADPKYRQTDNGKSAGALVLAGIRLGQTFIGIQPARGFNLDLTANYHDPDLVPPHSYLAYYFWLRHVYQVSAVVHVGKHGNLEWLPGKGTALSQNCWPDAILGAMPHFYPFIVNDPGEGAQAKRRTQATIIDHLMPPMTRAETYGELAELEELVDEYYQAMDVDARREAWLKQQILEKVKSTNLLDELGNKGDEAELLNELDTYLCEIKEAQIRHGLHILGELPDTDKLADTLVALLRLPRGEADYADGILHNLGKDLTIINGKGEVFDPFTSEHLASSATAWQLAVLNKFCLAEKPLRNGHDIREALEIVAKTLISDLLIDKALPETLPRTAQQLAYVRSKLYPSLQQSVDNEVNALLSGLNGQFIEPGPSGAPTRGRLDVLPTGRNFYAVDNRAIPSKAAWALGEKSAQALLERHLQEHGDYLTQVGLSVWGTATMRTGGDDIAQAFALMGIKPIWAAGSNRVVDFEIIPKFILNRPRVDVTLRVSGFFRDAFPNVMRLYDAAVSVLAELAEDGNSIYANVSKRTTALVESGLSPDKAKRQASFRVFGSKPGAYGAGLQGLIDERCWETSADLAEAYINWGAYAYGDFRNEDGVYGDAMPAKSAFSERLANLEAVIQNQDNREHDLLDSDDYYQFQGGMANAVTVQKGEQPSVYHSDHSNPAMPKINTLQEELNRVIRARVLNPKWITSMQQHGYKGAFEMAATVDYLFAYDATTNSIADYQYKKVCDALLFDKTNQAFLTDNNINALVEMGERMLEAIQRGMWQQPDDYTEKIEDLLIDLDEKQEGL